MEAAVVIVVILTIGILALNLFWKDLSTPRFVGVRRVLRRNHFILNNTQITLYINTFFIKIQHFPYI